MNIEGLAIPYNVWSSPMKSTNGGKTFYEMLLPNSALFTSNVRLLMNHDESRIYANSGDGSLELFERSDGVHFKAELPWGFSLYQNSIVGMSFRIDTDGIPRSVEQSNYTGNIRRTVRAFECSEISIITVPHIPAYPQTWAKVTSDVGYSVSYGAVAAAVSERQTESAIDYWRNAYASRAEQSKTEKRRKPTSQQTDYSFSF